MENNSSYLKQSSAHELQFLDIFSWIMTTIQNLCLLFQHKQLQCNYLYFFYTCFSIVKKTVKSAESAEAVAVHEDIDINREDIEAVMSRMKLLSHDDEQQKLKQSMVVDDFSRIFEDEEPSLEEVKEAFNVFDHNSDGFVDAEDLHRVMSKLGFLEKVKLQDCEEMIRNYDRNLDGRIDFVEFVRLMEISLQ